MEKAGGTSSETERVLPAVRSCSPVEFSGVWQLDWFAGHEVCREHCSFDVCGRTWMAPVSCSFAPLRNLFT